MFKTRCFLAGMALITAATLLAAVPVHAADDNNASDESQWIAILQSDAPPQDKAVPCKRLAVFGTKKAVPAPAPLLSDKDLSSWARIALEAIPDPSADEALREALKTVDGRLLVGVINSIGVRRDAEAVDALTQRLTDDDAEVVSASAVALGRVGNTAATAALQQALADAPAETRSAIAEGCILCAERLLAGGDAAAAGQLYDKIREADVSKQRLLEATRGAILARGDEGLPLLVEQLESPDKARFGIGLRTVREMSGPAVTEALLAQVGKASDDRQAPLILALAQRDDDAVLPAILQTAKNGSPRSRTVAIEVLQRVGDASCVPTLLAAALESDAELAQAAKASLAGLAGTQVDEDLTARLSQADGETRRLLIELVGLRRINAISALRAAVDDSDQPIRAAALAALGATVGPGDLSILVTRAAAPKNSEDTEAARQALRAACVRMPDREACAEQLAAAMSQATVPTQCALLEILAEVGGKKALESVGTAAADQNPELRDTASRLLGGWMTVDAAPVLLELAKTSSDERYQVRALRGYIRIVRQFVIPLDERAEMCRAALAAATRDPERELVLDVLERYPSVATLGLAVEVAKTPSLKDAATKTSLAIAQKLGGSSADVQELLAQVGQDPVKVEIIKAEYGAGDKRKDVTRDLQRRVGKLPLVVLPASYNASFGGDPAPGVRKKLDVQYKINDKQGEASFEENAAIILPMP